MFLLVFIYLYIIKCILNKAQRRFTFLNIKFNSIKLNFFIICSGFWALWVHYAHINETPLFVPVEWFNSLDVFFYENAFETSFAPCFIWWNYRFEKYGCLKQLACLKIRRQLINKTCRAWPSKIFIYSNLFSSDDNTWTWYCYKTITLVLLQSPAKWIFKNSHFFKKSPLILKKKQIVYTRLKNESSRKLPVLWHCTGEQ